MKAYVKPELFYERYELSKHIADCAWELTSGQGSCPANADAAKLPGMGTLFTEALEACNYKSENYEAYCYQPGPDGVNLFRS